MGLDSSSEDRLRESIRSSYQNFAENEARGRSSLYETFALAVADDPQILSFLAELAPPKRQPNLLFAAVKFLYGTPNDWHDFSGRVRRNASDIRAVMLSRSTQTNEPARCATLLPVLASLPQPLALLEVGTAAGLCLLPDKFNYEFNGHRIDFGCDSRDPIFSCQTNGIEVTAKRPEIVWRAGIDLNPIDVNNQSQVDWLEALVWPDEGNRLELLRAAIAVCRRNPPRVLRGDLRRDVPALVAQAPKDATVVIFHTSVLCYLADLQEKQKFAGTVRELGATWISNEGVGVLPWIAETIPQPWPKRDLLLALNEKPTYWTDPHGKTLQKLMRNDSK